MQTDTQAKSGLDLVIKGLLEDLGHPDLCSDTESRCGERERILTGAVAMTDDSGPDAG